MRTKGNIRKIDELGRIVLPAEIRRTLNISQKDDVELFTADNMLLLKKYNEACVFCGSPEDLKPLKDKNVCSRCIEELNIEN